MFPFLSSFTSIYFLWGFGVASEGGREFVGTEGLFKCHHFLIRALCVNTPSDLHTYTTMDKEALRKFYFSQSSSYSAFKNASAKKDAKRSQTPTGLESPSKKQQEPPAASVSDVDVSVVAPPSTIANITASSEVVPPAAQADVKAPAGLAINAARTMGPTAKKERSQLAGPVPNAASPEYFNFLKQQQELQHLHNHLEETAVKLISTRRDNEGEIVKLRKQASDLLNTIEVSKNWKLQSKYDVQKLVRDCTLSLQPVELVEDRPPQVVGIQQIEAQITRIKREYGGSEQFTPHTLFADQSIRRLSLLEKTLSDGNMDATAISRIADTLLVSLETVCKLPTVESLVKKFEEEIDTAQFNVEEARKKRDAAVGEGEVHVAERLCYDVIKEHEEILARVIAKARLLEGTLQEHAVLEQVRGQYAFKTIDEFERIRTRSAKLKKQCEEDLKKMFALREKVEEVETETAKRVQDDQQKSDAVLLENGRKLEDVFTKIAELEKEVDVLERERHREIQRRVQEKDKDEHRRAEYAKFISVVETHTVPLERTIRNMDLALHAADVMQELVDSGFKSLQDDLVARERLLKDVKLEAHKQHVEVLRGMLLELGEIVYKKERMVEETDKNIQQAHIQQELLAETFNPNAKRFGDVKKKLLLNRDDLENDVKELKTRGSSALDNFKYSEDALREARVDFIHPVTEQEQHTLAMKTKMMEFKALVVGHTEGQPLIAEIEDLKKGVTETRLEMDALNADTTGTMGRALPMIRAASKALKK